MPCSVPGIPNSEWLHPEDPPRQAWSFRRLKPQEKEQSKREQGALGGLTQVLRSCRSIWHLSLRITSLWSWEVETTCRPSCHWPVAIHILFQLHHGHWLTPWRAHGTEPELQELAEQWYEKGMKQISRGRSKKPSTSTDAFWVKNSWRRDGNLNRIMILILWVLKERELKPRQFLELEI